MKVRRRNTSMPLACAIGTLTSVVTLLVSIFISALFLLNEHLSIAYISAVRITTLYATTLIGALTASLYLDEKKAVAAIITGAVVAILQMGITLMLYKSISGGFLLNLILIVLAVATTILISKRRKPMRKRRAKTGVSS